MKKNFKNKAFTLAEALLVLVIIGIIATICVRAVNYNYSPKDDAWNTLSQKMGENLSQASLEILLNHAALDDFTRLTDEKGTFSIEDDNVTDRLADLFKKYLSDIDLKVDMKNTYFSQPIKDYNGTKTTDILNKTYSNFFHVNDGVLVGFRFYGGCNNSENNASPPDNKGKYKVDNICGSIFYDVNSYAKPNKLGSDQYILPVYKRGIIYTND